MKGREQTQTWADWTWRQQRHASHDKSIQAFPPFFVLQATKAGCGGLGTRLVWLLILGDKTYYVLFAPHSFSWVPREGYWSLLHRPTSLLPIFFVVVAVYQNPMTTLPICKLQLTMSANVCYYKTLQNTSSLNFFHSLLFPTFPENFVVFTIAVAVHQYITSPLHRQPWYSKLTP